MGSTNRLAAGDICKLDFDVDFPPGDVAAYLVPGDELVMVDAGVPGPEAREELIAELDAHGYALADVDHLVLTHPHPDHVGQVPTLVEEASPTVHAPRLFRERFSRDPAAVREASRANMRAAGVDEETMEDGLGRFLRSQETTGGLLSPESIDAWIDAGEPFGVGGVELEGIHTPGHHADHLCYEFDLGDERGLFSGDMVMEPLRAVTIHVGFDDGVWDGVEAFRTALDRLSEREIDRVFPGHGPVHTHYERMIRRSYIQFDHRLETCEELIRDGHRTAFEVAGALAENDPHRNQILPEIAAALGSLEGEGRVRSTLDDGVRRFETVD